MDLVRNFQYIAAHGKEPQQGLLYGAVGPESTEVCGHEPIPQLERGLFAGALAKAGRQVVGYYRIREGSGFSPTEEEISLARDLFEQPGSVVMLIERRAEGPAEATFFFWRGGAFVYNFPVPFPVNPDSLAAGANTAASGPPLPYSRGSVGALLSRARKQAVASPGTILGLAAGVVLGLLLGLPRHKASPAAPAGALQSAPVNAAVSKPPDLELAWDPAGPVAIATSAVLNIHDGGIRREVPISLSDLHSGGIVYSPVTGRVIAELTIVQSDGRSVGVPLTTRPAFIRPVPEDSAPPAEVSSPAPVAVTKPRVVDRSERPTLRRPVKRFLLPHADRVVAAADPAPLPPPPVTSAFSVIPALPAALTALSPPPRKITASGRIVWTGTMTRHEIVQFDGDTASIGSITGGLPGVPASLKIFPVEISHGNLVIYTTEAARHNHSAPAVPGTKAQSATYIWDPDRVSQLVVLERPNSANQFNRLVLRNEARHCPIILIDWATL